MITINKLFTFIILIWISLYTVSYGLWTWKKNNKLGGAAVISPAVFLLALSVFSAIIRG